LEVSLTAIDLLNPYLNNFQTSGQETTADAGYGAVALREKQSFYNGKSQAGVLQS